MEVSETSSVASEVKWFVVVNPTSGGGRGLTHFPQISKLLRDNNIYHEAVFTEHKHHATALTVQAINSGYRHIIVVGGDGTLHEVINGLFIQKCTDPKDITIAVISAGTGNDWIRMFGIPTRYSEAIRAIKEGYTFLQDVAAVDYEESRYRQTRYMANVAGVGFDAAVIKRGQMMNGNDKKKKGAGFYIRALINTFFRYKPTGVKIWVNDRLLYNNLLFSLAMGVGKYNGGGIQQLPKAVANDGLLDITLIKPLHWWHIVFRLKRLFNGGIYSIGHIKHAQGRQVHISSVPPVALECDGELMGGTDVDIEVVPQAIQVVVTKEFLESQKSL